MISKNIIKKSGLYFIGNFSSKILSALLIPIFAYYVTVEDLGYFDFSQSIMNIITPIIILAIWEAVLRFILSENDEEVKRKIITTAILFTFVMAILFIGVAFIYYFIFDTSIRYLYLIISMIVLHSFVYVWQYYSRAVKENKLFVISGIISTVVNFCFIIIFVIIMKKGLLGLLLAYNLGQISILITIEVKVKVLNKIKLKDFDTKVLKKLLYFSIPLVLNLTSTWLISGFGRLLVILELGSYANGIYSFANRFSLIITMIGSVITMAIIEEAIITIKKNGIDKEFKKSIEGLFKVFQWISILAIPSIVVFYSFLQNTGYYESLIYAPWLLLFAIATTMSSNIGSVFQAINKTKYQFFTTILGAFVTVVISVFLIKLIGISAVIIGQIAGAISMLIARYLLVNKFVNLKINWNPIILRTIIFVIVTILCLNVSSLINIFILVFMIVVFFYLNMKSLVSLFKRLSLRFKN